MALKALSIFQGDEWMTYRWSVAAAHDTLDRMAEACHPQEDGVDLYRKAFAALKNVSEPVDMLTEIPSLCDDLQGDIDTILADLGSTLAANPSLQWKSFEMQSTLKSLKTYCKDTSNSDRPHKELVLHIKDQVEKMRDLLRMIDV